MSTQSLSFHDVSALRGGSPAVRKLSLTVKTGEVVALIGLNGAGKSSLMRAAMGLEPLAGGEIRLGGIDLGTEETALRARQGIGYCPEGRRLFPGMRVSDMLHAASRAGTHERRDRIAALTRQFPLLGDILDRDGWSLSGGQQQVAAIARALMNDPKFLLLDEPSLGLAPIVCQELFPAIRALADGGCGILLAEQSIAAAQSISDRVAVMHRGQLIHLAPAASVTREQLRQMLLSDGEER